MLHVLRINTHHLLPFLDTFFVDLCRFFDVELQHQPTGCLYVYASVFASDFHLHDKLCLTATESNRMEFPIQLCWKVHRGFKEKLHQQDAQLLRNREVGLLFQSRWQEDHWVFELCSEHKRAAVGLQTTQQKSVLLCLHAHCSSTFSISRPYTQFALVRVRFPSLPLAGQDSNLWDFMLMPVMNQQEAPWSVVSALIFDIVTNLSTPCSVLYTENTC